MMEDFLRLAGKTVLVTGGSRGIGEGIVRGFVAAGASVVLNYVASRERAEAIAEELGRERCLPVQADLGKPDDIDRLWRTALDWKGGIDVLVNNTSVRTAVSLDASSEAFTEHWMHALQVNLIATAHLSRLAIAHFKPKGGGVIVSISAHIGVRGDRPEFMHDGASKGGMNSLMRGMARFHATEGVLTYLVSPGIIKTQQLEDIGAIYGEDMLKQRLREIPAGHFGEIEDVVNVVLFCASGRAAYSSGALIDVSGAAYIH